MFSDTAIICYQHCRKDVKVFCFSFPEFCNFCQADLSESELRIPPFQVPYPFKIAIQEANSIVIKPTTGDFLNCYNNASNLHIGVTNSEGLIYEYDSTGLMKTGDTWSQCLVIKVLEAFDVALKDHWDKTILATSKQRNWTSARYCLENHNCYTFVLVFLNMLKIPALEPYIADKTSFCEHFIVPQTRIAAKYIGLYRRLKREGIVVQ